MRIGVLSDLHIAGEESADSMVFIGQKIKPIKTNPLSALKALISQENFNLDYLVCPGDIANKAHPEGFKFGIEVINELAIQNKTQTIINIGNHDIDSHHLFGSNPYEHIRKIPTIPTNNSTVNAEFWLKNYCFIEKDAAEFLILNSNSTDDNVFISQESLEDLETDLKMKSTGKYKVAVLHHHPIEHSDLKSQYTKFDIIKNGDKFLNLLSTYNYSLVIHGHKHEPRITKYQDIIVFAVGSLSSNMNVVDLRADNCFHIVQFSDSGVAGTIETFIYSPKMGWFKKLHFNLPMQSNKQ